MSSQLEALRARIKPPAKRGRKKIWKQPEVDDFAHGIVLPFDQTLTKTGWVLLRHDERGLVIIAGGVLRPEVDPSLRSFEQTFAKAEAMGRHVDSVVRRYAVFRPTVVHEMPAVVGYRLESSLMAAREIRRAARMQTLPVVMVARQRAYSVLVGAPSVEKAQGTATVNRLIPKHKRSTTRWTQDVHDAALLGLQWLHERKEAHGD